MNIFNHIHSLIPFGRKPKGVLLIALMLCFFVRAQAQLIIGGNVYGGGDMGNVGGSTTVKVLSGDVEGSVFGGARMANVGGNAFVNIDGTEQGSDDYILIDRVYGGNDISGTIGTSTVPAQLTKDVDEGRIDASWNAFVQVSNKKESETLNPGTEQETTVQTDIKSIYIGQLFGGGNGEYAYSPFPNDDGEYELRSYDGTKVIATRSTIFLKPELQKTYIDINGGSIVYAYGGGNNATVTEKAVISIDNPSDVVNSIKDLRITTENNGELLTNTRFKKMGINTGLSSPSSDAYQIGRLFGGNNMAPMAIRPTWNLERGSVRNVYSGGNKGDMTSPEGLLLEIPAISDIVIDNLYGGCRMADVHPKNSDGSDVDVIQLDVPGYNFPAGLSARTLVRGGDVHNVYGGNDVTGNVVGGNAIGIYTNIRNNVYGGGNGSYPYTDNEALKDDDVYGDLYYTVPNGKTSVEALNDVRPDAEQVSIHIIGTESKRTVIGGALYCGGNSATIVSTKENPKVELKVGSYVTIDKVFLGNNGENMVKTDEQDLNKGITEGVLRTMARTDITSNNTKFNSIDFKDETTFAQYMEGAAMSLKPSVTFDYDEDNPDDPMKTYQDYTSYFGSIYCGGNVGSMTYRDGNEIDFSPKIIVYNKVVGGCNTADVDETEFNAIYDGGVLGSANDSENFDGNRLKLDFDGLKIQPMRWNEAHTELVWNTARWNQALNDGKGDFEEIRYDDTNYDDSERRLLGGNVYGGCYESGHVNGNIVININEDLIKRDEIFAGESEYRSGVQLEEQSFDVMTVAMTVFGAGYGENTEVWGSTTVNLNDGYAFQIFGGGELGVVGKKNDSGDYYYNPKFSTTVRLNGENQGYSEDVENGPELAEAEYLYAAGNEGLVCGDSHMYLGNGRIYDSFGGASNADILGHAETYIGINGLGQTGFPWVRDIVYGGNDFGGEIKSQGEFKNRVSTFASDKVFKYDDSNQTLQDIKANAYVEYQQGVVDTVFGGSYGFYDYSDTELYGDVKMPRMHNSFVNIRPEKNETSSLKAVFGAGTGYSQNRDGDAAQDHSYVLIDIPQDMTQFRTLEIFGAGSYNGLGMGVTREESLLDPEEYSAIIDLVRGQIGTAYGGSYNEGVTRRTMVNVPQGSTINIGSIYGGAYGTSTIFPCDVYEANVNYRSNKARLVYRPSVGQHLTGAIYGGNNSERQTVYAKVNISDTVYLEHERYGLTTGYVYGAGHGTNTWAQYTEVNLEPGAVVYEAYGGGQDGKVLNIETIEHYMTDPDYKALHKLNDRPAYMSQAEWDANYDKIWATSNKIGGTGYDPAAGKKYAENTATNLSNPLVRVAEIDDRDFTGYSDATKSRTQFRYNTNVIVHEGAYVNNYVYGGGYGADAVVSGSTYVALLGGEVKKDIYAAGTSGAVENLHRANDFTASTNVYIEGGTVRNVYGGGWRGNVGYAEYVNGPKIYEKDNTVVYEQIPNFVNNQGQYTDVLGETHVVIGKVNGTSHTDGIPSITRNVYGGGEGGSIFGTAHLTINNGYIGYRYNSSTDKYVEEFDDEKPGDNKLAEHGGNAFGGGYVANSYVDNSDVKMYGGTIRGSLFGGGEIGPIGRGTVKADVAGADYSNTHRIISGDAKIYKAGQTHVRMFNGHVMRNVFGGGRGYDNWRGNGWMDDIEAKTMDLSSKGYVFGQTDVNIYGGEVGTDKSIERGDGNVFGGGDEGIIYSAYMQNGKLYVGKKPKDSQRFDGGDEGYYYRFNGTTYVDADGSPLTTGTKQMTEDCHVLVEPWLQVTAAAGVNGISYNGKNYYEGDYIPTSYLNTLPKKNKKVGDTPASWPAEWNNVDAGSTYQENGKTIHNERGIVIHNAVFAGGNVSASSTMYANVNTVFGNATASINDVYHRDLITIGTGRMGGLYGDGNLTFVDGYRELNITSYGTDYFNIDSEITIEEYENDLSPREQAYYELRYKCIKDCKDKEDTYYRKADEASGIKASTITTDELITLFIEVINNNGTEEYKSVMDGNTAIMVKDDNNNWIPNPAYWVENGVCSRYAGRPMNTIQRADFCGVFGSRMVMQGAQDRVPETVDYTNYTINRVREVSLNKKQSVIIADYAINDSGDNAGEYVDPNAPLHGNYFGIYNIVNYLGALTSDVDFTDLRVTDNRDAEKYKSDIHVDNNTYSYGNDGYTYYNWKKAHYRDNTRNNGNSHNQVALASGVYLELTTEKSTGEELYEKDWGIITGVVELDLINVSTGIGGGFVYAKNVHGMRDDSNNSQTTLSELNSNAVSNKQFTYSEVDAEKDEWEVSGNFVHSTQTIIDDCYNIGGRYLGATAVPAHYWFIKGQVYVYDQYLSAYTGASNAFSETVDLPLTITAASHGQMRLVDVKKNRYAVYTNTGSSKAKLTKDQKLIINEKTYYLNDPIDYWEWSLLSASERDLFVEETFVNCVPCRIDNDTTLHAAGTFVMTSKEFTTFCNTTHTFKDINGDPVLNADRETAGTDYVFRSSNNMSHELGYILTYDVNNPGGWDKWYSPKTVGQSKIDTETYKDQTNKSDYYDGPTYRPTTSGLYGQNTYKVTDIITKEVYDTYHTALSKVSTPSGQATFEPAYITTAFIETTDINNNSQNLQVGAKLAKSQYSDVVWTAMSAHVAPAYICTNTIKLGDNNYIVAQDLLTETKKEQYIADIQTQITGIATGISTIEELNSNTTLSDDQKNALAALLKLKSDIEDYIVPAYYCSKGGLYGGDYYDAGHNYRALQAWSSLSVADRQNFTFNYDALDLLIDPTFSREQKQKYQYDGYGFTTEDEAKTNPAGYSVNRSIDYTATFSGKYTDENSTSHTITQLIFNYSYVDDNSVTQNRTETINVNDELKSTTFEKIPNEQRHYSRFSVTNDNKESDGVYRVYIVNTSFINRDAPYAVGQVISADDYKKLGEGLSNNVTILSFASISSDNADNTYYFCREPYTVGKNGEITYSSGTIKTPSGDIDISQLGTEVTSIGGETISKDNQVPLGYVIDKDQYDALTNLQLGFTIHGVAPKEYSTLYVSRHSDIYDLSKDKIITAIYQYDYEESNESGTSITPVSERHVVNIHIQFKSGIPTVGAITSPDMVLPGTSITLKEPEVTPGAYEIIGSGWELFEKPGYAENHTNGAEYTPVVDPLYWYQDGFYLAYYTKTYLGKTYSNHVPVSVANYHDLKKVLEDKYHMYVDHDDVKRSSKIYINDYNSDDEDGIELLKDFYDLSLLNKDNIANDPETGIITALDSKFKDHHLLNSHVKAGNALDFILRADINHTGAWTPIASGESDPCFSGALHGDGYTISGLDNSLFAKLCGDIYNLGVTGTFTGAGIAETGGGYIENCWISTSSTAQKTSQPIFGNPSRMTADQEHDLVQIVNSYYLEDDDAENKYSVTVNSTHGTPIRKGSLAFYNGEVAYNLNGFYLNKRYYDGSQLNSGTEYRYIDYSTQDILVSGHYPAALDAKYGYSGYVEERYADGDFRFAGGSIPLWTNERERTVTETIDDNNGGTTTTTTTVFVPVWPKDYLFFGQKLTYGYDTWNPHQNAPSHYEGATNRVYRAPAYYGNSEMSAAHFNSDAVLAANNADGTIDAYPGMTAIDFTGYNDSKGQKTDYKQGLQSDKYYAPLLDFEGLTSLRTDGQTRNMLAYANQSDAATTAVINGYFIEPEYDRYAYKIDATTGQPTENLNKYYNIHKVHIDTINMVHGHLVLKLDDGSFESSKDHFLVDEQDFNAPISYAMAQNSIIWYQRTPNAFVRDAGNGWESISLPFTVKTVTTSQKGMITHFYEGSKIGHEYWLRIPDGIDPTENNKVLFKAVAKASSADISAGNGIASYTYTNSFLYDYYYNKNNGDDANSDKYHKYYNNDITYKDYPLYTGTKPYLIGFPSDRYYEFDMSGQFEALNTALPKPGKLDKQTITFISDVEGGIIVGISDEDYDNTISIDGGYTFRPTYQHKELSGQYTYLLNNDGTAFRNNDTENSTVTTKPFRAYFTAGTSSHALTRSSVTRANALFIGYTGDQDDLEERAADGGLYIYGLDMSIWIESSLDYPTQVTITTVAGKQLKQFTIQPGAKVQVPVNSRGVYIVNHKKIAVTK